MVKHRAIGARANEQAIYALNSRMMDATNPIPAFMTELERSLTGDGFVSVSLGNYKGSEDQLKNIYVKKALIKKEVKLSFTYRYKTRDIVKNFPVPEGVANIRIRLNEGFKAATLFTTEFDLVLERLKGDMMNLRKAAPTKKEIPSMEHDKAKHRAITAENKPYLHALGITDKDGNVLKNAQDKYRQINHYIELLSPLIKGLPEKDVIRVADMGSGKGYLTFALYDYLRYSLNRNVEVTGVEFREDMTRLCNNVAAASKFDGLKFTQGTIADYDGAGVNMLIALHACDTATDDAIATGIRSGAELIVVAPCCHKQIRKEIEKHKAHNELDFITRHGIFMEREAEMITDSLRALILEYFGYTVKVFEFVSDVHTPKNIMITASRNGKPAGNEEIAKKIKDAKAYFGIGYHHLERLMEL